MGGRHHPAFLPRLMRAVRHQVPQVAYLPTLIWSLGSHENSWMAISSRFKIKSRVGSTVKSSRHGQHIIALVLAIGAIGPGEERESWKVRSSTSIIQMRRDRKSTSDHNSLEFKRVVWQRRKSKDGFENTPLETTTSGRSTSTKIPRPQPDICRIRRKHRGKLAPARLISMQAIDRVGCYPSPS